MINDSAQFAKRMAAIKPSFIREILKAADDKSIISFAGGLPNRDYFPRQAIAEISTRLMEERPFDLLQYGQSEGETGLRETIARRYREMHQLEVPLENIIITNGSQQGFDLIGKVLLDEGDGVVIESPGYLGATQSLAFYQPNFLPVPINANGMDIEQLRQALPSKPKLIYTVPNFQNPTGFSYSEVTRQEIARLLKNKPCLLIEDDPYGDIRFGGQAATSFYKLLPEQTILLGSFSKTIAPGLRTGWIVAPTTMISQLLIAKQGSDLHSNRLSQHIIDGFLNDERLTQHLSRIREAYQSRCELMCKQLDMLFGDTIIRSSPQGGMFIWLEFEPTVDAMRLFDLARSLGVVFVPGQPFYCEPARRSTARLNFSSSNAEQIETGLQRLYKAFEAY